MRSPSALERYLGSVTYEPLGRAASDAHRPETGYPVVTISRQAGAGAHVVADALVERLQARAPEGSPRWTIFDRNLVERVLEDHDLPDRLAAFMPEDRINAIADSIDELFGLHPPSGLLVRKTASTILRLAEIGNAVVIGRAANIITHKHASAFHVRLVGSLPRRIAYVERYRHLARPAAEEYVRDQDRGRARYVRTYYGKDVDDPLLYDLMVNTDRVGYAEAADIIAEAVLRRQEATDASADGRSGGAVVV